MKIKSNQISNFFQKPFDGVNAVLLYGQSYGVINERLNLLKTLISQNDDMRIIEHKYDDITNDASILQDSITSINMFSSGDKVIVVRDNKNTISVDVKNIITNNDSDNFIVFIAGELSPSSSLRMFFEKGKNMIAIPCYYDSDFNINQEIINYFKGYNILIDKEAVYYIASHINNEKSLLFNELEKIRLYFLSNHIKLKDIEGVVTLFSNTSYINKLTFYFIDLDSNNFEKLLLEYMKLDVPLMQIIYMIVNYLKRMLCTHDLLIEENNIDSAINKLKPPVFFKEVNIFKQHIRQWSKKNIIAMLGLMHNVELQYKKYQLDYMLSQALCSLILRFKK